MKTLEQLLETIAAGQSVVLNGEHLTTEAQVRDAYPSAKEAYDARASASQPLAAGIAELREYRPEVTQEDLANLRTEILTGFVSKETIASDYVPKADLAAGYVPVADAQRIADRNAAQATLIDALTTPERLAALDTATLATVAAFVGAKPGKADADTVAAILAKRGA